MRIYIAGPITGIDNWKINFADAEEILHNRYPSAEVINPLTLEDEPECIEIKEEFEEGDPRLWNWMLKRDITRLMTCTHIYCLRGWENSKGARFELRTAVEVGIKPLFER